jgi:hypothetical protein
MYNFSEHCNIPGMGLMISLALILFLATLACGYYWWQRHFAQKSDELEMTEGNIRLLDDELQETKVNLQETKQDKEDYQLGWLIDHADSYQIRGDPDKHTTRAPLCQNSSKTCMMMILINYKILIFMVLNCTHVKM